MLNNRLHRVIIGAVAGIVFCSIAGAGLLVSGTSLFLAFLCLLAVLSLASLLIRETGKTNWLLKRFFNTIDHNDFSMHFKESADDPALSGLFSEMNRIISQFEYNRTEQEERRLYYESIIRVLTHEIRNSVTPIASLSADLIRHTNEYEKEAMIDGLQTIRQQAQQLNAFLNAWHRLTHLPDPVRTRVDIPALFHKLSRLLSQEKGSEKIRFSAPEGLEFMADQNLITLALINLIRNALQATEEIPEGVIEVVAGRDATVSFIQVADNGQGIPPERQEDVFLPFYSTKKEGSGIGLPLSRRIMQLHGGELTLTAAPGVKTQFRMLFPN